MINLKYMHYKTNKPVVLFDLYQTLVDIEIDEDSEEFWIVIENYLNQYGNRLSPSGLKELYLELDRQIKSDTLKGQSILETLLPRYLYILTGQKVNLGQFYGFISIFRRASRQKLIIRKYTQPLLSKLERKGYTCGLVSNTEAVFTKIDLEDLKLADKFKCIVLSSDVGAQKPDPKPYFTALSSLGASPEAAIFIGDNFEEDIVGAHNAGIRSILLHDIPQEYLDRLPESCVGIIPTNGRGLYKKIAHSLK